MFKTLEGEVCWVGRHIGRVFRKVVSTNWQWFLLIMFGWGVNLFYRSAANRFALSNIDMAKELSGLSRGSILLFSFRIFFVALHSELSEFERDFK